jgi:hypothetical protein
VPVIQKRVDPCTTEVVDEQDFDGAPISELTEVSYAAHRTRAHRTRVTLQGLFILDVPFRRPDAPNGVDKRLSIDDMITAERRYVLLCAHHILAALVVLLSLEFIPRPSHLWLTQRSAT